MINLKKGDCLELLNNINDELVDMVLTDPPYSSGGLFAGDRKKKTSTRFTYVLCKPKSCQERT